MRDLQIIPNRDIRNSLPRSENMGEFAACPALLPLISFFLVFTARFSPSSATDTMDRMGSLRDGETLVSSGGSFDLGFFSPGGGSIKKYLCVRFIKTQEKPIVWVANRERPLNDSTTGVLKFGDDGDLVILSKAGDIVWSREVASDASGNRVAQLLDSGNLVVRDAANRIVWQSFDEPGNTLLPGMKLLLNTRTGASRHLTSWRSPDDPSPGNFSYGMEVEKLPQLVLWQGSTVRFATGLWNGVRFTGGPSLNANDVYNSSVVSSGDEVYYTDTMIGTSRLVRAVLNPSGDIHRFVWNEDSGLSSTMWTVPVFCELFAICGPFGYCRDGVFPFCHCPRGFRPKSLQDWNMGNGTDGCVRSTVSQCRSGDGFLTVTQLKLPDLGNANVSMGMSLEECRDRCAMDCSCTAHAVADIRGGGRGCITWFGGLVNMRSFSNNGQDLHLRVAASDMDPITSDPQKKKSKQQATVISLSIISSVVVLVLFGFWMMKKMLMNKSKTGRRTHHHDESVNQEDTELPLFDFETISSATSNFSIDNKIGEGGFGNVYRVNSKMSVISYRSIVIHRMEEGHSA